MTSFAATLAASGGAVRTVPPAVLPVTVDELKQHSRIDSDEEYLLIEEYIGAAVEQLEEYANIAMITQTWTETFRAFTTAGVLVRRRPLQSLIGLSYIDAEGVEVQLATSPPTTFRVIGAGDDKVPATVILAAGQTWPSIYTDPDTVRLSYVAGYGATGADVPRLIKQAVRLTAATWINQRENLIVGVSAMEIPDAAKNLLRPWRLPAIA